MKSKITGALEVKVRVYYLSPCGHFVQEADVPWAGIGSEIECPYHEPRRKKAWWKIWTLLNKTPSTDVPLTGNEPPR